MIKIFKSEQNIIAFDSDSLSVYLTNEGIAEYITQQSDVISVEQHNLGGNEYINTKKTEVDRLVLLITQTCNLRCSYCFAKTYMVGHRNKQVMSATTAIYAIEKFLKIYPHLFRIQFFGGEPLIGFETIKEAVKFVHDYCHINKINKPIFTITTNGTLINQDIINFFKSYDFRVTVSLDGTKYVNDEQRRFVSGKGSFDKVLEKINLLQKEGIKIRIEAVYTANHIKYKETIESTYKFLQSIGANEVHLTPALAESCNKIDDCSLEQITENYELSTKNIMDSFLTDKPFRIPYLFYILDALVSQEGKEHFCDAGFKGVTVDLNGNVYPCYILIDDSLNMGNIYDTDFPGEKFLRVSNLLFQSSKNIFQKCYNCWARKLCSACYGDSYWNSRTLSPPQETMCAMIQAIAKAVLIKLAEFRAEDSKWKQFVKNINTVVDDIKSGFRGHHT